MHIKRLGDCKEITAGDGTRLRELLHPERDATAIRYSLAEAWVEPAQRSKPHRLATTEVYYIMSGRGVMHIDEEAAAVEAGDAVYIPPGSRQWLENAGGEPLHFLCVVDPAWRAEDEEVLPDIPLNITGPG